MDDAVREVFEELNQPGAARLKAVLRRRGIDFDAADVDALVWKSGQRQVFAPRQQYPGKVSAPSRNARWAADSVHLASNPSKPGGEKYILVVQDIFSRRVFAEARFGPGPSYRLEMRVTFPESMGGDAAVVELETAPIAWMPHAVYVFLDAAVTRKGPRWSAAFHRNAGHVLQAFLRAGPGAMGLAFQEYDARFPHEKYTLGFAGRPGPMLPEGGGPRRGAPRVLLGSFIAGECARGRVCGQVPGAAPLADQRAGRPVLPPAGRVHAGSAWRRDAAWLALQQARGDVGGGGRRPIRPIRKKIRATASRKASSKATAARLQAAGGCAVGGRLRSA